MDKRSVRVRPSDRTEADLQAAIRADEERTGRIMTPREQEAFARGFFAPEYIWETTALDFVKAMMLEASEAEDGEG